MGYREGSMGSSDIIPSSVAKQERISGDLAMEIGKLSFNIQGTGFSNVSQTLMDPETIFR